MSIAAVTSADTLGAVIYTRVSSDRAGGRSVAEQERECRAVCAREGWPVTEVIADNDRSASRYATRDRPGFDRLRQIVAPGAVIVCWEASRLSRDMATLIALRDLCMAREVALSYGGQLVDVADAKFIIDGMMAEQESWRSRERTMRAHNANLVAGRPHGRLPYGYRIIRDPASGKAIGREPDPAQAPLIQEAARRVLDGHTVKSVVRWLQTKDPIGWDAGKLRRILLNPSTAGYRTHDNAVTGKGTWDAILTDEQHTDLLALFACRSSGPRGVPVKHLLSGIATCERCGEKMWRCNGGRTRGGQFYKVYNCPKSHLSRRQDVVDAAVHAVVEGVLATPQARAVLAQVPEVDPSATAHLAELKKRLAAVVAELTEGRMPAATGARVSSALEDQITQAQAAAAPTFLDPVVREIATAPDPIAAWRALPVTGQRAFIRATMTVTVKPIGRGRWRDERVGVHVEPRRQTAVTG
jgi:site-specific DNA recombinase